MIGRRKCIIFVKKFRMGLKRRYVVAILFCMTNLYFHGQNLEKISLDKKINSENSKTDISQKSTFDQDLPAITPEIILSPEEQGFIRYDSGDKIIYRKNVGGVEIIYIPD